MSALRKFRFRSTDITLKLFRLPSITSKRYLSGHKATEGDEEPRGPSYFHSQGTEPLRMVTTGQLLDRAAQQWPNREVLISVYEEKKLTFQQLNDQARQLAAGFLKLGLKPGDRLALIGVNSVHWYITMQAAAKIGLIAVMLNPAYTAQELGFSLKNVQAKAVVTDHKFKTQDYPRMLTTLAPGMSSAPHGQPLSCQELPDLTFAIVATEEKLPGCYRLGDVKDLATNTQELRAAEARVEPGDPVCIQFSSGTTGTPKGTVLSHFNVINNAHSAESVFPMSNENICFQLPLFHIFGASFGIFSTIKTGCTVVFPGPGFVRELTIKTLQHTKCHIICGTPTMFIDLANELKILLPHSLELRIGCWNIIKAVCGGAFIPPELITMIKEVFPNADIITGYGMTEMSGTGTLTFPKDSLAKKHSTVGYPLKHFEVKIVDDEGRMVPFGKPGEAFFRSPYNLIEYWNDEKKTAETKTKDGWLKSGDIMILNEDGYVSIVGRKKDMIIRGGENIFPTEIETFLLEHPEICNAEVYGVHDKRMGEEVAVSIKLQPSSTLTESNVKEYCKGKISHFKIPRYVRFVSEFPMTPAGKVKKFVLREMHEKEIMEKTKNP